MFRSFLHPTSYVKTILMSLPAVHLPERKNRALLRDVDSLELQDDR